MKSHFLSAFLLFNCVWLAAGQPATIPFQDKRPVIDGADADACWSSLPWRQGFTKLGSRAKPDAGTRFKIFHDNGRIYIYAEAFEPAMEKLKCKKYSYGSSGIWSNDSIEISLAPDPKILAFHKYIIDCGGALCDLAALDDNTNSETYKTYSEWSGGIVHKTARLKDRWTLEAAIPFGSIDFDSRMTSKWRLNVARNRHAGLKKPELTSWSPVPLFSHMAPKAFNEAVFERLDLTPYKLELEGVSGKFVRNHDGAFSYIVDSTIHNNSGSFRILNQRISLSCPETGLTTAAAKNQKCLPRGEYRRYSDTVVNVKPGRHIFTYELFSNNSNPTLLKKLSRNVTLEYQPVSLRLARPAYRDNIYATMPDKTIECLIELREFVGIPLNVVLSGENVRLAKTVSVSKNINRIEFDGAKLPDGRYTLEVTGTKNGRTLSAKKVIRKLPYQKGEVWLDRDGVTHIDGKKFFPYGWYGTRPETTPEWENNLLNLVKFPSTGKAVAYLKKELASGLRVMIFPFQDLNPKGWVPSVIFKDPDTRRKGLTKEQRAKITEFVSKVGKTDGLLGWYMADEPECRDNNPAWYIEARELIAGLDPYHPCIMLNWGPAGIKKYYEGCDILLPDCYPQYFEDGTTGKPLWITSEWAKTATGLRPGWIMPQMALWPDYARDGKNRGVPPDYRDQRLQFFQALIHNVKGFNMYSWNYSQCYSALIIGPGAIGKTIMRLREYLYKNTEPEGVSFVTEPSRPHFQAGVKMPDGKRLLIACNTSNSPVKVTFTFKRKFTGTLFGGGEKRSVKVINGVFSDTFAPKETHLYLTDAKLAAALPDVQKTEADIAAHLKARKKPGNLIGLGEILGSRYSEYGKGKIPAGIPKIKASSDKKYYGTLKTGSLYYLVDGLTEPLRPEFTWSPLPEDKKPWIEITLPAESAVKEVRLYSPGRNLTACRVTSGGETVTLEEIGSKVVSAKFSGRKTLKVRIEILKHANNQAANIGRRLLTEIEIY